MSQDIDAILRSWEYRPGTVQARLVPAAGGRQVIQMRVDLGVLQMETSGRPDGMRPHGSPTYFHHLQQEAARLSQAGQPFVLDEHQCQETDREFVQFYHRRICWLALRQHAQAVRDADHTLAFMNFVRDHSPDEAYTRAHEQYRPFVLFQRTQAAALACEPDDPEGAIDAIRAGALQLEECLANEEAGEFPEGQMMLEQLRKMADSLRQAHGVEETLREQLERAVANEDYETAARLRDALRRRR